MEQSTMFTCRVCGDEFATSEQLELHRREKHPQIEAPDAPQIQLQERSQYDELGEVF